MNEAKRSQLQSIAAAQRERAAQWERQKRAPAGSPPVPAEPNSPLIRLEVYADGTSSFAQVPELSAGDAFLTAFQGLAQHLQSMLSADLVDAADPVTLQGG